MKSLKQIEKINPILLKIDCNDEWYNGMALFHYYIFVFRELSLSNYIGCLNNPELMNYYIEYERNLLKSCPYQFSEIYSRDPETI